MRSGDQKRRESSITGILVVLVLIAAVVVIVNPHPYIARTLAYLIVTSTAVVARSVHQDQMEAKEVDSDNDKTE